MYLLRICKNVKFSLLNNFCWKKISEEAKSGYYGNLMKRGQKIKLNESLDITCFVAISEVSHKPKLENIYLYYINYHLSYVIIFQFFFVV